MLVAHVLWPISGRCSLPVTNQLNRSADVGTAHQFQGGLDVSPGFGFLRFAFVLVEASFSSGLDEGLIAMSLEELSGVLSPRYIGARIGADRINGNVMAKFQAERRTQRSRGAAGRTGG